MKQDPSRDSLYTQLGASADKQQVHRAIKALPPSLFPGAFCRVLPDTLTGNPDRCSVSHSDSAGTKCIVGYLAYREWGDPAWLAGLAVDATVMNLDDMFCVGARGPFLLSNTIARNFHLIGEDAIKAVIDGYVNFAVLMSRFGIDISIAGGETEDLGDIVRTISVGATMTCLCDRSAIVDNSRIAPGLVITGFSSTGRTLWEHAPNSGISSNGFTLARHRLLSSEYLKKYPEISDPAVPADIAYQGNTDLDTPVPGLHMPVGEALLSPTRTYAPFLVALFDEVGPARITGLVNNTGGGLTKSLNFGVGITYVKDSPFAVPPLFRMIRESGATPVPWREMYRVFNMGHRLELISTPEVSARAIKIADSFRLEGKVIGRTEGSSDGRNRVHVTMPDGTIEHYER